MRLLLCALFVLAPLALAAARPASTDSVAWQRFDQALARSEQSGRKVMVFVYTDWCGWCRKLMTEVYTDPVVSRYMNEHYELVRLNAESENEVPFAGRSYTERELASSLGIDGFPVSIFLKPEGKKLQLITKLPGYRAPDEYLSVLEYIAGDAFLNQSFEEFRKQREEEQ